MAPKRSSSELKKSISKKQAKRTTSANDINDNAATPSKQNRANPPLPKGSDLLRYLKVGPYNDPKGRPNHGDVAIKHNTTRNNVLNSMKSGLRRVMGQVEGKKAYEKYKEENQKMMNKALKSRKEEIMASTSIESIPVRKGVVAKNYEYREVDRLKNDQNPCEQFEDDDGDDDDDDDDDAANGLDCGGTSVDGVDDSRNDEDDNSPEQSADHSLRRHEDKLDHRRSKCQRNDLIRSEGDDDHPIDLTNDYTHLLASHDDTNPPTSIEDNTPSTSSQGSYDNFSSLDNEQNDPTPPETFDIMFGRHLAEFVEQWNASRTEDDVSAYDEYGNIIWHDRPSPTDVWDAFPHWRDWLDRGWW